MRAGVPPDPIARSQPTSCAASPTLNLHDIADVVDAMNSRRDGRRDVDRRAHSWMIEAGLVHETWPAEVAQALSGPSFGGRLDLPQFRRANGAQAWPKERIGSIAFKGEPIRSRRSLRTLDWRTRTPSHLRTMTPLTDPHRATREPVE